MKQPVNGAPCVIDSIKELPELPAVRGDSIKHREITDITVIASTWTRPTFLPGVCSAVGSRPVCLIPVDNSKASPDIFDHFLSVVLLEENMFFMLV